MDSNELHFMHFWLVHLTLSRGQSKCQFHTRYRLSNIRNFFCWIVIKKINTTQGGSGDERTSIERTRVFVRTNMKTMLSRGYRTRPNANENEQPCKFIPAAEQALV